MKLSVLFLLLNLFEIASGQDTPAPDPAAVEECANKMGDICGDVMLMYIFIKKSTVSEKCCSKLISNGRDCHDTLTEALLATKRFDNKRPSIMEMHNDVWTQCEKNGHIHN